ncbi:MAG: division/cell wall cluster transcriptional repressor MraZ [Propionibacteriaceae bacterium]|nr:division/cell wall cluster transcriptional repressor MraZ [Propionibacteriaceae bacterium]
MFLGTHTPKLDDKGRLILPAKFREALEEGLVVTRTQERALAIYPKETFEALMAPVSSAPTTVKQVRDYQRMLTAGASFEVPDKQGRITIPPILRAYAGLDRDVVVIGAMNRAEIWDATLWAEYQAEQEAGFAELDAELLSHLGQ